MTLSLDLDLSHTHTHCRHRSDVSDQTLAFLLLLKTKVPIKKSFCHPILDMLFPSIAATTTTLTLSAALLLLATTITALPVRHAVHPSSLSQPSSSDGTKLLASRQVKYDEFDSFWADWLKKQDQTLGGGGGGGKVGGGNKVKRGVNDDDHQQLHFKKYVDVYTDLRDARLKRLGRGG